MGGEPEKNRTPVVDKTREKPKENKGKPIGQPDYSKNVLTDKEKVGLVHIR